MNGIDYAGIAVAGGSGSRACSAVVGVQNLDEVELEAQRMAQLRKGAPNPVSIL